MPSKGDSILTPVETAVEKSKYSQRITEVTQCSAAIRAVKGTLSGSYFDKLVHIYGLERIGTVSSIEN